MTDELEIRYYKCGHCGVASSEKEWAEATLKEFESLDTDPVCPACGVMNIGSDEPIEGVTTWIPIVAPFTKEDLDELDKIKKDKADLEKKEKKLAPKVKDFLVANKINGFKFEGHNMLISYQDRSTMDEDKVVELIKQTMSEEEIEETAALKQVSNPDAITKLIADGRITMEQLSSCKIPNIIAVFNLNPKPKKEKSGSVDAFGGAL